MQEKEQSMAEPDPRASEHDLSHLGLDNLGEIHWNAPSPLLYEKAIQRREGITAHLGALVTLSGEHTGRSPLDKFIVREAVSENAVWWGDVNREISPERFEGIYQKMRAFFMGRDVFVQDCHAGADPFYRLKVRVVSQTAWHNLFARNMFWIPPVGELKGFVPDFTVLHAPGMQADPEVDGTHSGAFVLLSFERKLVLIGGTAYAGEIKKSVFSALNFMLPERGVLPMHCSANVGAAGDVAIFFGLSGTGKTTLSADPHRALIGDDEHGWSDHGVFNFEGGCYAKVIRLSADAEPQIYATTRRFGTILENVVLDPVTRRVDLGDARYTENTRASYPIDYIPGVVPTCMGGHPRNIFFLTADAFGVLPPLSKLTPEQAMYQFLSGYTAKVAGTEEGVTEPQATFSACFGAPFLPRHPKVYADLLGGRIREHKVNCWLINTGWTGGAYGVGHRMQIAHTRATLEAVLRAKLAHVAFEPDPYFGLQVPATCPGVPAEVLHPQMTWGDPDAYDRQARKLKALFEENYAQYES